jgi:pimeloyl-ACP methyl ester carboxylesterase
MAASRLFQLALVVSLAVAGVGLTGVSMHWPDDVAVERISFPGPFGRLEGKLWSRTGVAPTLAVLICHGVQTNKEVMDTFAIEAVRRGALALTFDYGGYGESERHGDELEKMVQDSSAALKLLISRAPGLKLVAIGHSMGATYATELARRHPEIEAVVAMGNEPVSPDVPPKNVMFAMGVFDVFHSVEEMLDTTRQSAHAPALLPNELSGDHRLGTARKMATSPLTDHGPEPLDGDLMQASFDWFEASVPHTLQQRVAFEDVLRVKFHTLAALGLGWALVLAWCFFRRSASFVRVRLHVLAFVGLIAASFLVSTAKVPLFADAGLLVLLSGMLAQGLCAMGHSLEERWPLLRDTFLVLSLAALCLLVGVMAVGFSGALDLGYVGVLPRSALSIALLRPFEGLCMLRAYAFRAWSGGLIPSSLTIGLWVFEALRPGQFFKVVLSGMAAFLARLRFRDRFSISGSNRTSLVAAVVFLILGLVLFKRFKEGWLEEGALSRMVSIGGRGLVLPFLLFVAVIHLVLRRRDRLGIISAPD